VWELNIRPLFRPLDRRRMLFRLDLYKYDDVKDLATKISNRTATDMPPMDHGGPWPKEWVDLFKRWAKGGDDPNVGPPRFARLDLAKGTYKAVRDTTDRTQVTVTASVVRPSPKSFIWFEEDPDATEPFSYVLYLSKANDKPRDIATDVEEIIPIPLSVGSIRMRAADGTKVVTIT
jgi:hypothetical protein